MRKTVLAAALVLMLGGCASFGANSDQQIQGRNHFGCSDKQAFNRLNTYLSSHAGQIAPGCVWFSDGEKVTITEQEDTGDLVKIRQIIGGKTYWTTADAVK